MSTMPDIRDVDQCMDGPALQALISEQVLAFERLSAIRHAEAWRYVLDALEAVPFQERAEQRLISLCNAVLVARSIGHEQVRSRLHAAIAEAYHYHRVFDRGYGINDDSADLRAKWFSSVGNALRDALLLLPDIRDSRWFRDSRPRLRAAIADAAWFHLHGHDDVRGWDATPRRRALDDAIERAESARAASAKSAANEDSAPNENSPALTVLHVIAIAYQLTGAPPRGVHWPRIHECSSEDIEVAMDRLLEIVAQRGYALGPPYKYANRRWRNHLLMLRRHDDIV